MMVFKLKHVCKLWLKKLAVYSLCALLLNQQLFYLSASIRQNFSSHLKRFFRNFCAYAVISSLVFSPNTLLAIHHIAFYDQGEHEEHLGKRAIGVKYWNDITTEELKSGAYRQQSPEFVGSWIFGNYRGSNLLLPPKGKLPFHVDFTRKSKNAYIRLKSTLNKDDVFNFYLDHDGNVQFVKVNRKNDHDSVSLETFGDIFIPSDVQKQKVISPTLGLLAKNIRIKSQIETDHLICAAFGEQNVQGQGKISIQNPVKAAKSKASFTMDVLEGSVNNSAQIGSKDQTVSIDMHNNDFYNVKKPQKITVNDISGKPCGSIEGNSHVIIKNTNLLTNFGTIQSEGPLTIKAHTLINFREASSSKEDDQRGSIISRSDNIEITTRSTTNTGIIRAHNILSLSGHNFTHKAGLMKAASIDANISGRFQKVGAFDATYLGLNGAGIFDNWSDFQLNNVSGNIGSFVNRYQSTIKTNHHFDLTFNYFLNLGELEAMSMILHGDDSLSSRFQNLGSLLVVGRLIGEGIGHYNNDGQFDAHSSVSLNGKSFENTSHFKVADNVVFEGFDQFTNGPLGQMDFDESFSLQAKKITQQGTVKVQGHSQVSAEQFNNENVWQSDTIDIEAKLDNRGKINSQEGFTQGSGNLNNSGILSDKKSITINGQNAKITNSGLISSTKIQILGKLLKNLWSIKSQHNMRVDVQSFLNRGTLHSLSNLNLIVRQQFRNTSQIKADTNLHLNIADAHIVGGLNEIIGGNLILNLPIEEGVLTINQAYIEAANHIDLQGATPQHDLKVKESTLITPSLETTATSITADNILYTGRLRVKLDQDQPFTLSNDLELGGVLEFAEPGVSLDSAIAKTEFEALYAPVTTPFEHEHTFTVDIQGTLRAEGLRVFGQHTLVKVGTQPLKYDEPGYDHTIGTVLGMIDARYGGEIDIFAHTFDLQKGHILAKNGAIRAPSLIHLGRLVRDPELDIFATFAKHGYALGNNIYNVGLNWGDHEFSNMYDGHHMLWMPWFIRNRSGMAIQNNFSLKGKLKHQALLEVENLLDLDLLTAAEIESGKIRANDIIYRKNKLTLAPVIADLHHDYRQHSLVYFHKRTPHPRGAGPNQSFRYLGSSAPYNKRHVPYDLMTHSKNSLLFMLSDPAELKTESHTFLEDSSLTSYASWMTLEQGQEEVLPVEFKHLRTGLLQLKIRNSVEFMQRVHQLSAIKARQIRAYVPRWIRKLRGQYNFNQMLNRGESNPHLPLAFLEAASNFSEAQQMFHSRTETHNPITVRTSNLATYAPNAEITAYKDERGMMVECSLPEIQRRDPVISFDLADWLNGFYGVSPLDLAYTLPKKFSFHLHNIWFDEAKANGFYHPIKDHIITRSAGNTFRKNSEDVRFIGPPKMMIEFVQSAAHQQLKRGFIDAGKPINADYIQQLHRNASLALAPLLSGPIAPTSTDLSTHLKAFDQTVDLPFLYYIQKNVDGEPVLMPELYIPQRYYFPIKQKKLAIISDNMNPQILRALGYGEYAEQLALMTAHTPIREQRQDPSGPVVIQGDQSIEEDMAIIVDSSVILNGQINSEKTMIVSLVGDVIGQLKSARIFTENGYYDAIQNPVGIQTIGDAIVLAVQGNIYFEGVDISSSQGKIIIKGQEVDIRAHMLESYKSYQQARTHITHHQTRAHRSNLAAAENDVFIEAVQGLITRGVKIIAGKEGVHLKGREVAMLGTRESDQITTISKNKGGVFKSSKTTRAQSVSQHHVSDAFLSRGQNNTLESTERPFTAAAPYISIPVGGKILIRSPRGAQVIAGYDIHQSIRQSQSSNMVRSVSEQSTTYKRIPRTMQLNGGSELEFELLPSVTEEHQNLPALTIEVGDHDIRYTTTIPNQHALPAGFDQILAQYKEDVQIKQIKDIYHHTHTKVTSISPMLSVAVGIAATFLTGGTGAGLLSGTVDASAFFVSAASKALTASLLQGTASQAVGDRDGFKKVFSERTLKSMAINMVAQYVGAEVLDGLEIDPTISIENVPGTMARIVSDAAIKGSLNALLLRERLDKSLLNAAVTSTAQNLGRAIATDIGSIRSEIDDLTHKILHGLNGSVMGALLNPSDPATGALSGATSAIAAEVIAEALEPEAKEIDAEANKRYQKALEQRGPLSISEQNKLYDSIHSKVINESALNVQVQSRLLSTLTTGLLELNVHVGDAVAQTALENNWEQYFSKKNKLHRQKQALIAQREQAEDLDRFDAELFTAFFPEIRDAPDQFIAILKDDQEAPLDREKLLDFDLEGFTHRLTVDIESEHSFYQRLQDARTPPPEGGIRDQMQRGMHAVATVVSPEYSPETQDTILNTVKNHPFVNAAQYAEIESYLKGERSWLAEKSLTVLNEVGMCMDVGVSLFRKGVRTTRDALGLQEIISDRNIDNATAVLEIFGVVKGLQKVTRSTLARPTPVRPVASGASGEAAAAAAAATGEAAGAGETNVLLKRNKQGRVTGVYDATTGKHLTQRHHILHEQFKDHPLLKAAGYDINNPSNLMVLPNKAGAHLLNTPRSIHQGAHYGAIVNRIRDKLEEVWLKAQQGKYTQTQMREIITNEIVQIEKVELLRGTPLNSVNRRSLGLEKK